MTIIPGVAPLGVGAEKLARSKDDESRILLASFRYFDEPASGKSRAGGCESAILGALRKYFKRNLENRKIR